MNRINKSAGTTITIYHTFHDEVRHYQTHVWKCDGPCQHKSPYFGIVRRSMNRYKKKKKADSLLLISSSTFSMRSSISFLVLIVTRPPLRPIDHHNQRIGGLQSTKRPAGAPIPRSQSPSPKRSLRSKRVQPTQSKRRDPGQC